MIDLIKCLHKGDDEMTQKTLHYTLINVQIVFSMHIGYTDIIAIYSVLWAANLFQLTNHQIEIFILATCQTNNKLHNKAMETHQFPSIQSVGVIFSLAAI